MTFYAPFRRKCHILEILPTDRSLERRQESDVLCTAQGRNAVASSGRQNFQVNGRKFSKWDITDKMGYRLRRCTKKFNRITSPFNGDFDTYNDNVLESTALYCLSAARVVTAFSVTQTYVKIFRGLQKPRNQYRKHSPFPTVALFPGQRWARQVFARRFWPILSGKKHDEKDFSHRFVWK